MVFPYTVKFRDKYYRPGEDVPTVEEKKEVSEPKKGRKAKQEV